MTIDVAANAWRGENSGVSFAQQVKKWQTDLSGLGSVAFKTSADVKSLDGLEDGNEGKATKESRETAQMRATWLRRIGLVFEKILNRNVVTDMQNDVKRTENTIDEFDSDSGTTPPKRQDGSVN